MTSAQVSESRLHSSFLLAPAEGEQLVGYEPGQYLSLRLDIPGTEHSHARNYSLSDAPDTDPVTLYLHPPCSQRLLELVNGQADKHPKHPFGIVSFNGPLESAFTKETGLPFC